MVYHGTPQQVLPYLEDLGFRCGEHENPADFILDVLTTCEKSIQSNEVAVAIDTGSDPISPLVREEDEEEGEEVSVFGKAVDMADNYQQTATYRETDQRLQDTLQQMRERKEERRNRSVSYRRNILWQVHTVSLSIQLKLKDMYLLQ
jgi:hypothetical protein